MHISSKCSIAVHCLIFLYEYGEQTKVTSGMLAMSAGCNPVIIRGILSALKKAGILTIAPGVGGAKLARAPEDITLYDLYAALEPEGMTALIGLHPTPNSFCPVGRNIHRVLKKPYHQLEDALAAQMQTITLAELLADYHSSPTR